MSTDISAKRRRRCNHARKGIVSNEQFGTVPIERGHVMISTCDREACIAHAMYEVQRGTGEKATFLSDVDRRAIRAAEATRCALERVPPASEASGHE